MPQIFLIHEHIDFYDQLCYQDPEKVDTHKIEISHGERNLFFDLQKIRKYLEETNDQAFQYERVKGVVLSLLCFQFILCNKKQIKEAHAMLASGGTDLPRNWEKYYLFSDDLKKKGVLRTSFDVSFHVYTMAKKDSSKDSSMIPITADQDFSRLVLIVASFVAAWGTIENANRLPEAVNNFDHTYGNGICLEARIGGLLALSEKIEQTHKDINEFFEELNQKFVDNGADNPPTYNDYLNLCRPHFGTPVTKDGKTIEFTRECFDEYLAQVLYIDTPNDNLTGLVTDQLENHEQDALFINGQSATASAHKTTDDDDHDREAVTNAIVESIVDLYSPEVATDFDDFWNYARYEYRRVGQEIALYRQLVYEKLSVRFPGRFGHMAAASSSAISSCSSQQAKRADTSSIVSSQLPGAFVSLCIDCKDRGGGIVSSRVQAKQILANFQAVYELGYRRIGITYSANKVQRDALLAGGRWQQSIFGAGQASVVCELGKLIDSDQQYKHLTSIIKIFPLVSMGFSGKYEMNAIHQDVDEIEGKIVRERYLVFAWQNQDTVRNLKYPWAFGGGISKSALGAISELQREVIQQRLSLLRDRYEPTDQVKRVLSSGGVVLGHTQRAQASNSASASRDRHARFAVPASSQQAGPDVQAQDQALSIPHVRPRQRTLALQNPIAPSLLLEFRKYPAKRGSKRADLQGFVLDLCNHNLGIYANREAFIGLMLFCEAIISEEYHWMSPERGRFFGSRLYSEAAGVLQKIGVSTAEVVRNGGKIHYYGVFRDWFAQRVATLDLTNCSPYVRTALRVHIGVSMPLDDAQRKVVISELRKYSGKFGSKRVFLQQFITAAVSELIREDLELIGLLLCFKNAIRREYRIMSPSKGCFFGSEMYSTLDDLLKKLGVNTATVTQKEQEIYYSSVRNCLQTVAEDQDSGYANLPIDDEYIPSVLWQELGFDHYNYDSSSLAPRRGY